MEDYYGYTRDVKPNGQILTSELSTLAIGGKMDLVQQAEATYSQNVMARFEAGSPTLYWMAGQPMGSVTFSRLVGCQGYLARLKSLAATCGKLTSLQITSQGQGGCATACRGGAGVTFEGGMVENVRFGFNVGSMETSEGATIRVAAMRES